MRIVPANEAPWEDQQAVIGTADSKQCQCQRFKLRPRESFGSFPVAERANRLVVMRIDFEPGQPRSRGLLDS